jgi:general secretion pathway protein G
MVKRQKNLEVVSMRKTAFTLVEILIVVVILGILAAIVIPQFTSASNDARQSGLASDLQTSRSQLQLYKTQHLERWPSLKEDGTADTANFIARMTGKTDSTGKINAAGVLGPYLMKWPTNPFAASNQNTCNFGTAEPAPGDGTSGWYFNTTSGKLSCNDSANTGL